MAGISLIISLCDNCNTRHTGRVHGCMSALNDECLTRIFKYLSFRDRLNIAQVCQKWNVVSTSQAWDNVHTIFAGDNDVAYNLKNFNEPVPDQQNIEKVLKKCGRYLSKLVISGNIESSILEVVKNYCVNIKHLELGLYFYDANDFVGVFECLQSLEQIIINKPNYSSKFHAANLHHLNKDITTIGYCSGMYSRTGPSWCNYFSTIVVVNYHNLRTLKLENLCICKKFFSAISKISSLSYLSLTLCQLPKNYHKIKDLKNLEYLELKNMINMPNDFLENISNNMSTVKGIALQALLSPKLKMQSLNNLCKMENLKYIRTSSIEYIDNWFIDRFKNLTKVEVCGCPLITDWSIIRLLGKCSKLEILNVIATSITVNSIERADFETKWPIDGFYTLKLYADYKPINDFKQLGKSDNPHLILEYDSLWRDHTNLFDDFQ